MDLGSSAAVPVLAAVAEIWRSLRTQRGAAGVGGVSQMPVREMGGG